MLSGGFLEALGVTWGGATPASDSLFPVCVSYKPISSSSLVNGYMVVLHQVLWV